MGIPVVVAGVVQPDLVPLRQAVARSTAQLSRDLRVRAIAVRTRTGTSATVVAATIRWAMART